MIPLPLILGGIVAAIAAIDRHEKAGKKGASDAHVSETGSRRDGRTRRRQPRPANQGDRQPVKADSKPAENDPPKEPETPVEPVKE